ncbi:MAG: hypothetical protein Ta2A_06260 [Treponemataceae bacterium]|nr:MAG: hypothetical protein Ta2A_06260 [Treponemataceae bacterium]
MKIAQGVFSAIISIFSIFAFSCANTDETLDFNPAGATLFSIINEKDAKTDWFSEENTDTDRDFNKKRQENQVNVTIENYMALRGQNATYPSIDGFANLDTSLLNNEQVALIENFCTYVLASDLDKALEISAKETSILMQIFFSDIDMLDIHFVRYVYGQPLIQNALWQIPVRFITDRNAFFDIWLYFDNETSSSQINQIAYKDSEYD